MAQIDWSDIQAKLDSGLGGMIVVGDDPRAPGITTREQWLSVDALVFKQFDPQEDQAANAPEDGQVPQAGAVTVERWACGHGWTYVHVDPAGLAEKYREPWMTTAVFYPERDGAWPSN